MDCPVPSSEKRNWCHHSIKKLQPICYTYCLITPNMLICERTRLAACKWNSTSKDVLWKRPPMANHVWPYYGHIYNTLLEWLAHWKKQTVASFVRVTFLCAFRSKPVAAKFCTSKLSNMVASGALDAKKTIGSAYLRSKTLGVPSCKPIPKKDLYLIQGCLNLI